MKRKTKRPKTFQNNKYEPDYDEHIEIHNKTYIEEIKNVLQDLTNNKKFSTILYIISYFVKNNNKKILIDEINKEITIDTNSSDIIVLKSNHKKFSNENEFLKSIKASIISNKGLFCFEKNNFNLNIEKVKFFLDKKSAKKLKGKNEKKFVNKHSILLNKKRKNEEFIDNAGEIPNNNNKNYKYKSKTFNCNNNNFNNNFYNEKYQLKLLVSNSVNILNILCCSINQTVLRFQELMDKIK